MARRVSPAQARRFLALARILPAELPRTFALLREGAISEWRAMLIARETIFLSAEHRAVVEAELARRMETLGDARIAGEARRAAQRLNPAGAAERARNAVKERRVSIRPAPDTMCWLGVLAPVHQSVSAYASLRHHADSLIGTGSQGVNDDGSLRSRDQIMTDTLIERITGQAAADDVPIEITLGMTDQTLFHAGETETGSPSADSESASTGATDTPYIADTVDTEVAANEPGFIVGYGPVPAPVARDLALRQTEKAKRWIRRLFLTPDGRDLAAMDSRAREFTANQKHFIRIRDHDTCRTPWCDAPIRHTDHVTDWNRGGNTATSNGQGLCEACNHTKQAAGWRTTPAVTYLFGAP